MLKHKVLKEDITVNNPETDYTNYLRIKLLKLSFHETLSFIYPKIYALHEFISDLKLGEYEDNTSMIITNKV